MTRDTKIKAEERFPITGQGFTSGKLLDGMECQILLDTGATKSYMSKSYYLQCKTLHALPKLNRSILCNCDIEAESNFLLESLAACEGPDAKIDLEMHFTVNLAFVNYFEDMIEELQKQISLNWTTQEQILPISLEIFEISPNLINAPKTL